MLLQMVMQEKAQGKHDDGMLVHTNLLILLTRFVGMIVEYDLVFHRVQGGP
jgi:hypothetical protein